jgi:magnesium transporter
LFIVFRLLDRQAREPSEQVSLFLCPGLVITFQERSGDSFDHVRTRLRHGRGLIRTRGADYLTYALLDSVIDHYFPVLEAYDDLLDDLTETVLREPKESIVRDLHRIKRELFNLRRIVWASREMLNNLMRTDVAVMAPETRPYLRDCYDHCVQLMDMLEMQREVTASLFDIYLSSLSNRLNEIMKVLTMIATIFIPLGFIASLYGMNFDTKASPWNMPELHWALGYPFALALMGGTAVGLVFWFRKRGWIGGRRRSERRRHRVRRAPRPTP